MAQLNFGGVTETVVIRDEFPLEKAREVLKDETIAVIGNYIDPVRRMWNPCFWEKRNDQWRNNCWKFWRRSKGN